MTMKSDKDIELCESCRFFFHTEKNVTGECRRFPPFSNDSHFPVVYPFEWCGEYQREEIKND